MAKNNSLKKQAQAFASEHDLPYLTALKAVTEPYHGLRSVLQQADGRLNLRFRVTGEESAYQPVAPQSIFEDRIRHRNLDSLKQKVRRERADATGLEKRGFHSESPKDRLSVRGHLKTNGEWDRLIEEYGAEIVQYKYSEAYSDFEKEAGWSPLSSRAITIELGRRAALIEDSGARDIWKYRELYRAGLLGSESEALEPMKCYADVLNSKGALFDEGPALGMYPVLFDSYFDLNNGSAIPVTLKQLDDLFEGREAQDIRWPIFPASLKFNVSEGHRVEAIAEGLFVFAGGKKESFTAFFGPDSGVEFDAIAQKLKDLGLDPDDFTIRPTPGLELRYENFLYLASFFNPAGERIYKDGVSSFLFL